MACRETALVRDIRVVCEEVRGPSLSAQSRPKMRLTLAMMQTELGLVNAVKIAHKNPPE